MRVAGRTKSGWLACVFGVAMLILLHDKLYCCVWLLVQLKRHHDAPPATFIVPQNIHNATELPNLARAGHMPS